MTDSDIVMLIKRGLTFTDLLKYIYIEKYELLRVYERVFCDNTNFNIDEDIILRMKKEYIENSFFLNLTDEETLFYSDLHKGSIYENYFYMEQLKYFIEREQIKIVFDGGDIGDGLENPYDKNILSYEELKYVVDNYPIFHGTIQNVLGGNHDRRYRDYGKDILEELSNTYDNINPLGYNRAYFKIYDKVISFEHNCTRKVWLVKPDFKICGHVHDGRFKERGVLLPSSCDHNTNCLESFTPGFMTLQPKKVLDDINLYFTQYAYTDNGPEKVNSKVYTIKKDDPKIIGRKF